MSRRAIKPINWAAFAETVLEHDIPKFNTFKAKSDRYLRRMMKNPAELPKIDWTYYEKKISIPGMVQQFKNSYESIKVPYPEDKYTKLVEQEEAEGNEQFAQFIELSNAQKEQCAIQLGILRNMKPFEDMSMEEFEVYFKRVPILHSLDKAEETDKIAPEEPKELEKPKA